MNYFKPDTDPALFHCPCGDCEAQEISQILLDSLNQLRYLHGRPIIVNSGYRCPKHNKRVGGQPNSEHLTGEGVDIRCDVSQDRWKLVKLAQEIFPRVGIDARFLHLGVSTAHPGKVLWLYPPKTTGAASGSAPRS